MIIKSVEKYAFEPLHFPAKATPSHANFGSNIPKTKVDWKTGNVSGDLCKVVFHMNFEDTKQFRGITPGKPAIFFTAPLRMVTGKVYELVW